MSPNLYLYTCKMYVLCTEKCASEKSVYKTNFECSFSVLNLNYNFRFPRKVKCKICGGL